MKIPGAYSIAVFAALAGSAIAHEPATGNPGVDVNADNLYKVHGCWEGPDGQLEGGIFYLPRDEQAQQILDALEIANRGIPDNRVDFVIVGDGYTATEQDQFHTDATAIANNFFRYEPFITYEPYFRISQIEVVSNESGVDNDPSQGISRDTALDMSYWCSGTERLLCVNVGKAYNAAASAPDIDQVIAIANSSKYGGAGYPSDNLGTAAGQNSAAVEIAIHEMGHSLGDLADEYTYGGPSNYNGNEPTAWNASIFDRDQQLDQNRKWYRWMDASLPGFDNPVRTVEGANYSVTGIYRPSNNSMMRNLARPFNLPSAERLIREIYREVNPIDDGTPDGAVLEPDAIAWITPMQPVGHDLSIVWYLNDQLILSAVGVNQVDLSTLNLLDGENTLRVDVADPTPWVRNETIRNTFMSESRSFTVAACISPADLSGDGMLDFFDVSIFLSAFNEQDPIADFDEDGMYTFFDVSAFLTRFSDGGC